MNSSLVLDEDRLKTMVFDQRQSAPMKKSQTNAGSYRTLSDTRFLILLRKLRKEHCYRCRDLGEISPADRADLIKRPWQQQLARAAVRLNVTLVINRTVLIFVVLKKKHVTDHDGIVVLTETRCLGAGLMETFR